MSRRWSAQISLLLKAALIDRGCTLYGDSKCAVYKVQNRFRRHIWLKGNADSDLIEILRGVIHRKYGKRGSDLSVTADVNPYSMN